ncbi:MAG: DegT/DnrJ/EryC1/StrS family aminotransferase [Acidobacteria bacterium]|nr:DegT/DnrJ/EryC1/StrS family aminotransferase [Acidobacteriota bacterium]
MWKARLSELEFDDRELSGVLDALDSSWITAGPRTEAFEKAFTRVAGTSEAIAVSNGTAALFLALRAIGIGHGDEVLCPSLTFVATAAAVMHCGAKPILVDICSLQNPTLDPVDAKRKITPRTKAILPVHYAGIPADMDRIRGLAEEKNLHIVEDCAHSPGARFDGKSCGSLGDAGCFSFFGNKNMTTAEGGMITTSDPEIARRVRLLRSHGMTVTSWDRDKGRASQYDVLEFGFNYRFDDIRAAIGLVQLEKLESFNRRRKELVSLYDMRLGETCPELILPFAACGEKKHPSYHIYPVVFGDSEERDRAEQALRAEGIQTSLHYPPIHSFTAYANLFEETHLPITEAFASRELTLPLYPSLSRAQVEMIASCIVHCSTVSAHL